MSTLMGDAGGVRGARGELQEVLRWQKGDTANSRPSWRVCLLCAERSHVHIMRPPDNEGGSSSRLSSQPTCSRVFLLLQEARVSMAHSKRLPDWRPEESRAV